jgi:hypothetical protein
VEPSPFRLAENEDEFKFLSNKNSTKEQETLVNLKRVNNEFDLYPKKIHKKYLILSQLKLKSKYSNSEEARLSFSSFTKIKNYKKQSLSYAHKNLSLINYYSFFKVEKESKDYSEIQPDNNSYLCIRRENKSRTTIINNCLTTKVNNCFTKSDCKKSLFLNFNI